jgi:hypothetical protein
MELDEFSSICRLDEDSPIRKLDDEFSFFLKLLLDFTGTVRRFFGA